MILRDRDMTDAGGKVPFTGKGDGTLEERVYYCQNLWGGRADVSALVDYTSGACLQLEHDKYLSYGTPWVRGGLPAGDLDSDGDYDINDEKDIDALILATGYDVRADADLDGAVTAYDKSGLSGSKITLGRGLMSDSGTFNRRGYAGYDNDGVLGDGANPGSNTRFWHVRHRVLDSTIGRWTCRDADTNSASMRNSYSLDAQMPVSAIDPDGKDALLITGLIVGCISLGITVWAILHQSNCGPVGATTVVTTPIPCIVHCSSAQQLDDGRILLNRWTIGGTQTVTTTWTCKSNFWGGTNWVSTASNSGPCSVTSADCASRTGQPGVLGPCIIDPRDPRYVPGIIPTNPPWGERPRPSPCEEMRPNASEVPPPLPASMRLPVVPFHVCPLQSRLDLIMASRLLHNQVRYPTNCMVQIWVGRDEISVGRMIPF